MLTNRVEIIAFFPYISLVDMILLDRVVVLTFKIFPFKLLIVFDEILFVEILFVDILFEFNEVMAIGVLTIMVENTAILPFREETFAVEAVNVLSCIVENSASFPEIFIVDR